MTADATDLHVETFGDAADPTVLLVAGASASADWWDERWCRMVAEGGRHVVRYDHRDTGESPTDPPGAPTYGSTTLSEDVVGVLDALGVGGAHLVGLSMGGGIAQTVALTRPERVLSLTLMSTSGVGGLREDLPAPSEPLQEAFTDPPADPDWQDDEAVVAWWVAAEELMGGGADVDRAWVEATTRRMLARAHDVAASQNHWIVLEGNDDAPALDVHDIGVPTLVLHGDLDPLFPPRHGQALAEAVPTSRFVLLDGVGHQAPPPRLWPRLAEEVLAHTGSDR